MRQGYVLLMMLVYLQIFSLLAMQVAADVVYQKKSSMHRLSIYQLRRDALRVLVDVDHMAGSSCEINKMSASELAVRDIHWWRSRGCYIRRGEMEYFYVREALGIDHCGVIISENKQQLAVQYHRNTLLQVSTLTPGVTVLLQDSVASAGSVQPVCSINLKHVKSGRQMLRWL